MKSRPVGAGGVMVPPDLGKSVSPISTRGADYAEFIITTAFPFRFSDLPAALMSGECPSWLEGEVKPLRAERKLNAAGDQSASREKPF